jgi:hypothetical protein
MARSKARHKQSRDAKHVRLYWHELESEAWRHASLGERCLYIELKYRFNGSNNGYISMSQREAGDLLGCKAHTAGEYFKGLQDKGFIALAQDSAFNMKRMAREWRLTEYPCHKSNQQPTKDYRRWKPAFTAQCRSGAQAVPVSGTMGQTEGPNSAAQGHYEATKPPADSAAQGHTTKLPRGGGAAPALASVSHHQSAKVVSISGERPGGSDNDRFGPQIRRARQARGLNVTDLAKRSGVGRSTLSNIEAGRYEAGPKAREALLAALEGEHALEVLL